MSTTPNIWADAVADAAGRPKIPLPGGQAQSSDIWGAAVNDALGVKTPAAPVPKTPSEVAFQPMRNNQPSPAAMGGYFLPRYESPEEATGGAIQAGTGVAAAGAGGLISALTAPSVAAKTVGTGVLDASGQEIMKQISALGPSAAAQAFQALKAAGAAHPLARNLILYSLAQLGLGGIAHKLGWLGAAAAGGEP